MFGKRKELERRVRELEAELNLMRTSKAGQHQLKQLEEQFAYVRGEFHRKQINDALRQSNVEDHLGARSEDVVRLRAQVARHETALQKLLLIPGLVEVPEVHVPAHFDLPREREQPEKDAPKKAPR